MLKITFLEPTAHKAKAAKRFFLDEQGNLDSEYITGAFFTSHTEKFAALADMYTAVKLHAVEAHALLKGNTNRQLTNERRRGSTTPTATTNWIVFDIDGLKGIETADEFMEKMGYKDAEYITQYSASSGVNPNKGLSCHIIARLDKHYAAPLLKEWLKSLNFDHVFLAEQIGLTKTNAALSWPLDITTCQNDKLIFIAPPEVSDGIKDNFIGERITYHPGNGESITPIIYGAITESNKTKNGETIDVLREALGLPKKAFGTATHASGVEILKGAPPATVTGVKPDGEYVRINLNGGDSWAYYHPATDASILGNFKGEPNYLLKELDPLYYAAAQKECQEAKKLEANEKQQDYLRNAKLGTVYTAIRDVITDRYYTVIWDHATETLDARKILNKDRINDFLKGHGLPEVDHIPDWMISHDLQSDLQFDAQNRKLNMYCAPELLRHNPNRPIVLTPPPAIHTLVSHLMAYDTESINHFYNWLASVVQNRTTPKTAWILHGTQGTGKGLFFTEVLAPLFGTAAIKKPYLDFEDKFNSMLGRALLVFVDEVSNEAGSKKILQKLKTYITDEELSARAMGVEATPEDMYAAFIFTSNNLDMMLVEEGDRRFNTPPRQEMKLEEVLINKDTFAFVDLIRNELEEFAAFLHSYTVDPRKAARPMDNASKALLLSTNETTITSYCKALKEGDINFFINCIPSSITNSTDNQILVFDPLEVKFMNVMEAILDKLPKEYADDEEISVQINLPRDDLQSLYNFVAGGKKQTSTKFTQMLKHENLHIKPIKVDKKTLRGIAMEVKCIGSDIDAFKTLMTNEFADNYKQRN